MKTRREILSEIEPGRHAVQYYTDEWFLARTLGFYVNEGLLRNQNSVIICTRPHALLFEKAIYEVSERPASELKKEGRLTILDAEETLSLFMADGFPDINKFNRVIGETLDKARANGRPVRAYGEMVNILWQDSQREAALQLESCWNQILKSGSFFLLCAYALDNLSPKTYDSYFDRSCHCHDIILPAQDPEKFQHSVNSALVEILGDWLFPMITAFAAAEDPRQTIPDTQKYLLWLSRHMPMTTQKILARIQPPTPPLHMISGSF